MPAEALRGSSHGSVAGPRSAEPGLTEPPSGQVSCACEGAPVLGGDHLDEPEGGYEEADDPPSVRGAERRPDLQSEDLTGGA